MLAGPAATVDRDTGALVVCFYDTSGDPGRHFTNYSCTLSRDGARTWTKPAHANRDFSNETLHMSSRSQYGDYSGVAAAGGFAHPIWTQSRTNELAEEVYTASLDERAMR
jgi:hypothetical protein